jgi:hypothetical protein
MYMQPMKKLDAFVWWVVLNLRVFAQFVARRASGMQEDNRHIIYAFFRWLVSVMRPNLAMLRITQTLSKDCEIATHFMY